MILLSRSSGKKTKIKWLGPLTQRFDHKKVNKCKKFHFLTNLKFFWLWFFSQKISNINLLLGKKPKNAKKTCFTLISYNLDEEKSIFQQLVMEDPLFKGKRWLFKNVFFMKYLTLDNRLSWKKTEMKRLGPLTQIFDHRKMKKHEKFHFWPISSFFNFDFSHKKYLISIWH